MPQITIEDMHAWDAGTHFDAYRLLGAHPDSDGVWFSVWAPYADSVAVIGDFNEWNDSSHPLELKGAGIWQVFVAGLAPGVRYKYHITRGSYVVDKTDPYAFAMEAPATSGSDTDGLAALVTDIEDYEWGDQDWLDARRGPSGTGEPVSVYEVHLGSWLKNDEGLSLGYRQIAKPLAEYVQRMGFTHVEFMPVMEHPYYGSWGYQVIGYFAPTFRYGTPADLMYLIDYLHQQNIGVILDWVPAHFATDPQGLVFFDGSTLYEYDDPKMRYHPDWGTYVFDYNKPGVRNFLISNALFWLDKYHVDGLRFDAVASLLYRDYSREDWSPNMFGGRENLEAIDFLKKVNEEAFRRFPEVLMIAEESTAWGGVSQPTYNQGLGFLYKWNMGWMHDTLLYMSKDPVHRKYHHNDFSFPLIYAFSERYMLPLSHDEVVHGKRSLWEKMPGDPWQKGANLKLLFGHMYGHPGKKLLFMGGEFGQIGEWQVNHSIEWHLLDLPLHKGVQYFVEDLNHFYRESPALWNDEPGTFHWIDLGDAEQSVVGYLRRHEDEIAVFLFNFTPVPREGYRFGLPVGGPWTERLNSDAERYGGGNIGNGGLIDSEDVPFHGMPASAELTLPPLGVLILTPGNR